jgi:acyl-CoA thioester hydrolase
VTGARLVMDQQVVRGGQVLFSAVVTVVCIGEGGAPARLPANIRLMLH